MFYGWTQVWVSFVVQLVVMGAVMYSFGFFLKPIAAEIGAGNRFGVSWALPILFASVSLLSPAVGRWVDRGPIRVILVLGCVVLSAGLVALSRVETLVQFYLVYAVFLAAGMALAGGIAHAALITNWFVHRRGTALGISQFGVSFSGVFVGLLVPLLIGAVGWRHALLVFAVPPVLLLAPLIWWTVVDRPEDRGQKPDGDPGQASERPGPAALESWTLARAAREPSIWLLALIIGCCFAANGTMAQLINPFATDEGFSPQQAGLIVSCMALMGAFGKPLYGWLGDHIDLRLATWSCLGVQALGLLLLLNASSFLGLTLAAMVYGTGYGGVMPLHGLLVGSIYGRQVFGRIMGLMMPLMLPFQLLGMPLSGLLFDKTGSYASAFGAFLGFYALAATVTCFLRLPDSPPDAPPEALATAEAREELAR